MSSGTNEAPVTGDPWIDAYLKLMVAWRQKMPASDLTDYARELRRALPSPSPPPGGPADMFIRADRAMRGITPALIETLIPGGALWMPNQ